MIVKGRLMKFIAFVLVWLMISLSIPQFPAPEAKEKDSNDFAVQIARILSSMSAVSVAEAINYDNYLLDANKLCNSANNNKIGCAFLGDSDYELMICDSLTWMPYGNPNTVYRSSEDCVKACMTLGDKCISSTPSAQIQTTNAGKITNVIFNPPSPKMSEQFSVVAATEGLADVSSAKITFYDNVGLPFASSNLAQTLSSGNYAGYTTLSKSGSFQYKIEITSASSGKVEWTGQINVVQAAQQTQTTQQQNQYIASCEPCISAGRAWCISYGNSGVPSGICSPTNTCGNGYNAYTGSCPTQLSCQDACSAKYYGYGGGYNANYNYNQYGTSAYAQASYGYPVGTCYNRALQLSSIMLLYSPTTATSANAANVFIQPPQPIGSYNTIGSLGLCSDPEDVCWCAILNMNAAYATGTATIPGTTQTKHWPPNDQYYVKSADEPKKAATDADCTQKSTLTLANVRVNNQTAKVQTKLIAAGQPITIDGEVKYSSTVCNGYQYTCEKFTVPDVQCDQGREGFLGMTQYKRHKDCAKIYPDMPNKLGGEGEDSSFCWGCMADIGIILLVVAAMAFLGVPPEVAIPAGKALMDLTPALDDCPVNYIDATFQAANALSNIPSSGPTVPSTGSSSSSNSGGATSGSSGGGNSLTEEGLSGSAGAPFAIAGNNPVTGKSIATIGVAQAEEVCDVQPNGIDFAEVEKNIYLQDELMAGDPSECQKCKDGGGSWCSVYDADNNYIEDKCESTGCQYDSTNDLFEISADCPTTKPPVLDQQNQNQQNNQQQNNQQINQQQSGQQQTTGDYTGDNECIKCVHNEKKVWCAQYDTRGVERGGRCVQTTKDCTGTGVSPIEGNPFRCVGKPSYGVDDAIVSTLQMLPYAPQAWNCDLLRKVDCWSVCGREYTVNVSAAPRCSQGGPVKKFTEAQYTCAAPVSCGGLANHPVTVQIVQGDNVIKEDTTTTDENGKFSLTVVTPNVDGEVSVIIKSSV